MDAASMLAIGDTAGGPRPPLLPPVPESISGTGLPPRFLLELLLKHLLRAGGEAPLELLAEEMRIVERVARELLTLARNEGLVEAARTPGAVTRLSDAGRARALNAHHDNPYVGPAPISLGRYTAWVHAQASTHPFISRQRLMREMGDAVVDPRVLEDLGAAAQSRRSLLVLGATGNGKSLLVEGLARAMRSSVYVPHAVLVGSELVAIYDVERHQRPEPMGSTLVQPGWEGGGPEFDPRFVQIQRPCVLVGSDLELDELEVRYDERSGVHRPPLQLAAAGGLLVIDDFGRQRAPARAILQRLLPGLDRRSVPMRLRRGSRASLPLDAFLVFVSNLPARHLGDEALLRRLQYKVVVPGPTRAAYAEIFQRACARLGVGFEEEALERIFARCYSALGARPRASDPECILQHLIDRASIAQLAPELSGALLEKACDSFLASRRPRPRRAAAAGAAD